MVNLLELCKNLQQKIEKLEAEIENLKAENKALKIENAELISLTLLQRLQVPIFITLLLRSLFSQRYDLFGIFEEVNN